MRLAREALSLAREALGLVPNEHSSFAVLSRSSQRTRCRILALNHAAFSTTRLQVAAG